MIGNIQVFIRESVKSDVYEWEETLNNVINRYKNKFGEKYNSITLAIENTDEKILEKKLIFKEFIERRKLLEKKEPLIYKLTYMLLY